MIGYYALVMATVARHDAPPRLGRGMPDTIPVLLLARLAVASDLHGQGLCGRLLVHALHRCAQAGIAYSARAVVVDAINERATAFYRHFGFRDLEPPRLFAKLADIRRSLEP